MFNIVVFELLVGELAISGTKWIHNHSIVPGVQGRMPPLRPYAKDLEFSL